MRRKTWRNDPDVRRRSGKPSRWDDRSRRLFRRQAKGAALETLSGAKQRGMRWGQSCQLDPASIPFLLSPSPLPCSCRGSLVRANLDRSIHHGACVASPLSEAWLPHKRGSSGARSLAAEESAGTSRRLPVLRPSRTVPQFLEKAPRSGFLLLPLSFFFFLPLCRWRCSFAPLFFFHPSPSKSGVDVFTSRDDRSRDVPRAPKERVVG